MAHAAYAPSSPSAGRGATLPGMARLDRLREFVDRLHPSGLLYATYEHRLIAELDRSGCRAMWRCWPTATDAGRGPTRPASRWSPATRPARTSCKEFVEWCDEIGIPVVTLWVLSTDNFSRSGAGRSGPLLGVIEQMVTDLAATRRWRVHPVGALDLLPGGLGRGLEAGRPGHRRPRRDGGQHRGVLRRPARTARRGPVPAGRGGPATGRRSRNWPRPWTSSTSPSTSTPRASPTPT